VVRDDVRSLGEPPRRHLVQDLTLVGHKRELAVERRLPVGRDEHDLVGEHVRIAHLAGDLFSHRQVGRAEAVREPALDLGLGRSVERLNHAFDRKDEEAQSELCTEGVTA
jgi:hypothetical protein